MIRNFVFDVGNVLARWDSPTMSQRLSLRTLKWPVSS